MCYGENIGLKFNILNPVKDKKKPFYDENTGCFYFRTTIKYRYFLEVSSTDPETNMIQYYILIAKTKFNENCRLCEVDGYGKCKIRPKGELKEYIKKESIERGNLICNFIDRNSDYDTYIII